MSASNTIDSARVELLLSELRLLLEMNVESYRRRAAIDRKRAKKTEPSENCPSVDHMPVVDDVATLAL